MYINFVCPPLPHLILGGTALYRAGDKHEKRNLSQTFDLVVVRSGRLYLQEEDRTYTLERGNYLVLASDTNHKGHQCCESNTCFYWMHFYTYGDYSITETLPKALPYTRFSKQKLYKSDFFHLSIPQNGSINDLLFPMMEKNLGTMSQYEVNRFLASSKSTEATLTPMEQQYSFLRIILAISQSEPPRSDKPTLGTTVLEHLNEHFTDPFDLNALAKSLNFHPGYIIRCVNRQCGMSPLQLLLNIRIEKAKQLFSDGKSAVRCVSQAVGFDNPAYFSRQFKQIVGLTPTEYRSTFSPTTEISETPHYSSSHILYEKSE